MPAGSTNFVSFPKRPRYSSSRDQDRPGPKKMTFAASLGET